jgi:hypothetical protein
MHAGQLVNGWTRWRSSNATGLRSGVIGNVIADNHTGVLNSDAAENITSNYRISNQLAFPVARAPWWAVATNRWRWMRFATGGPLHQTRFVIVNDRLPRVDEHCVLCGGIIEKGYVRDRRTGLIYCDTQCFAEGARMALPIVKNCGRKMS